MDTIQEVRDIVYWRYLRECKMRGLKPMHLKDGEFKVYYDTILEEMFQELNISVQETVELALTPVTTYTTYTLGDSFGGLVDHEIIYTDSTYSSHPLEIVQMGDLPTTGSLTSGFPNRMAIFEDDGVYKVYLYPLASKAGTLTVRFKKTIVIEAGAGSGADLTKDCVVPKPYQSVMILGLLSLLLPNTEFEGKYEMGKQKKLEQRPIPNKGRTEYSLGGFDDEDIDRGFSKNWLGES